MTDIIVPHCHKGSDNRCVVCNGEKRFLHLATDGNTLSSGAHNIQCSFSATDSNTDARGLEIIFNLHIIVNIDNRMNLCIASSGGSQCPINIECMRNSAFFTFTIKHKLTNIHMGIGIFYSTDIHDRRRSIPITVERWSEISSGSKVFDRIPICHFTGQGNSTILHAEVSDTNICHINGCIDFFIIGAEFNRRYSGIAIPGAQIGIAKDIQSVSGKCGIRNRLIFNVNRRSCGNHSIFDRSVCIRIHSHDTVFINTAGCDDNAIGFRITD